jgi:hypothetical protein
MPGMRLRMIWPAVLASSCSVGTPAQPTVIPAPLAPVVATERPGVWQSREELEGWVTNGLSSGSASVVDDDSRPVIRIDLPAPTEIRLYSPAFDQPLTDLRTLRIRYRWQPDESSGRSIPPALNLALQAPMPDLRAGVTELFLIIEHAGAWVEEDFTWRAYTHPPFSARGAVLDISGPSEQGRLEIASLALVRQ